MSFLHPLIGGRDGCKGKNILLKTDEREVDLGSKASVDVKPGVMFDSTAVLLLALCMHKRGTLQFLA